MIAKLILLRAYLPEKDEHYYTSERLPELLPILFCSSVTEFLAVFSYSTYLMISYLVFPTWERLQNFLWFDFVTVVFFSWGLLEQFFCLFNVKVLLCSLGTQYFLWVLDKTKELDRFFGKSNIIIFFFLLCYFSPALWEV